MNLSRRVAELRPSSTVAIAATANRLRAEGQDVVSFAAGQPDFDTPQKIKDAAAKALTDGKTGYGPPPGDADSRAAVAEKLARENGIAGLTPEHVVLSSGGKQCLYLVFQALLDPGAGHEVILPTPAWVSYVPQIELAGGTVVEVPAGPEQHFKITPEQLRAALTPRSRLFVLNSPSNPCGVMYTPDEIRGLAAVLAEAASSVCPDLVIVTDEIYEKLIYGDAEHLSMGAIPEIADRTVTINGLSKAYAMTGWRLGYLAAPGAFGLALAKGAAKLQGQISTCVTHFVMPAVRVALEECGDEVEEMRLAFARRAERMYTKLSAMPGVVCPPPTGAFYAFPDLSAHFGTTSAGGAPITSAVSLATALLEEQLVAAVPGDDFGGCGDRCVRFSFACSDDDIDRGMDRLAAFLGGLSARRD